jgi:superfamily II DNA or RNA helicase
MCKILSSRGYNVLKENLSLDELETMKSELTVAPFVPEDYAQVRPIPFKLYQESATRIYMPKYYGLKKFGEPDVNKLFNGSDIDIEFNGSLRANQEEPVAKYLAAARDPKRMGGIINMYCGGGKTGMAIYIMCVLKTKSLIVCHKDFLLQQWKERIEQFTKGARIGMIKAKTIDVHEKDIILASLQSLSMKTYDEKIFQDIGLVVLDECHHLGAEVFSQALKKVNFRYALGLSATVNRKDGLTKVFKWYLGDLVFKATKRQDELNVNFLDFYDPNPIYSLEVKGYNNKLNVSKMINNICDYEPRADFIIKTLHNLLVKEPLRKVIILSDRRNHLEMFRKKLNEIGLDNGFYVGGMKQDELKASEGKQVILATYHIAAEGFDCPGLDTLILASPKSDVIQCVGRIQRIPQPLRKHVPLVLDIVDNFSLFSRQAMKRYKYYESCKYTIEGKELFQMGAKQKIELKGHCFIDDATNDGSNGD